MANGSGTYSFTRSSANRDFDDDLREPRERDLPVDGILGSNAPGVEFTANLGRFAVVVRGELATVYSSVPVPSDHSTDGWTWSEFKPFGCARWTGSALVDWSASMPLDVVCAAGAALSHRRAA